jgi:hypothetical protein
MSATSETELSATSACLQRVAAFSVRILRPKEVLVYLDRHPDMTDLLEKASAQTEQEFGNDAELTLELYRDPEIDDQYLTLYVRQATYDKRIMDRIETVRARYRDALSDKSGWLHVTTDFCPPGTDHAI